jgi:sulfite exporter TauE/SafE
MMSAKQISEPQNVNEANNLWFITVALNVGRNFDYLLFTGFLSVCGTTLD